MAKGLTAKQNKTLIGGVYSGDINVFNMSETATFQYNYTFETLDDSLHKGYGAVSSEMVLQYEKAVNYRQNIGTFSGSKSFHNVNDLTRLVFTSEGKKMPFNEYRKLATQYLDVVNLNYLKTEQSLVFRQAQQARKWVKSEAQKEVFPLLQYVTAGDERVRDSHAELDGIVRPVDDPFWNSFSPANGWNCRCTTIQLRDGRSTSKRATAAKSENLRKEFKQDLKDNKFTFNYNAGKTNVIFKDRGANKHPYYKVPRQLKKAQKQNFGFDIPEGF